MSDIFVPPVYSDQNLERYIISAFPNENKIDPKEAANLLSDGSDGKIKAKAGKADQGIKSSILTHVISLLPPELIRSNNTVKNINLLPILKALKNQKDYEWKDPTTGYINNLNDKDFSKGYENLIKELTTYYTDKAKTLVASNGTKNGKTYTASELEVEAAKIVNAPTAYSADAYLSSSMDGSVKLPDIGTTTDQTSNSTSASPWDWSGQTNGPAATGLEPQPPTTTTDSGITLDNFNVTTGATTTGLDYTEYLQSHYGDTILDLLKMEEVGSSVFDTSKTFNASSFITDITGKVPASNNKSWDLSTALKFPYQNPKSVAKLQESLRSSGYFEKIGKFPISNGTMDDNTALAWNLFLSDSMRNDRSPADEMKFQSETFAKRLASGEGVTFIDPAAVSETVQKLGSSILGRGLDQAEADSLTQQVRNWQIQANKQQALGQGGNQIDIQARIGKYLETTYHDEAVMNGLANTLQNMKQVFG
jgi:hypothetical protein